MIKIFNVAYKNLLRKKTRSGLTIIGIALAAWVLVSLLGFNKGYESSLNRDIDNLGFQMIVTAKGCPYEAATLMLKGGTGLRYMPQNITEQISKEPELGYEAAELEQREVGDLLLITEKNVEVKVVGILKRTGTQDDGTIFLPLKAVQKIFGIKDELTGIRIRVKKDANIAQL